MSDSVQEKRFGKEIVVLGLQVYKQFSLNYLLKICFFDSDYSVFEESEIVHRYEKSMVVHIRSMSRIVNLFHKHGKSAFSLKNNGKEFTCAGKVNMKECYGGRQGISYILDDEQIIMETYNVVSMGDVELPEYNRDKGV